jgi:hypothetical protein
MIRGGPHEEFLDEHVPEWESLGEDELGEVVSELAEDEEYPQVFEDTTGQDRAGGHSHEHANSPQDGNPDSRGHDHTHGTAGPKNDASHGRTPTDELPQGAEGLDDADLDGAPEDVLAEARELTRKRYESEEGEQEEGDAETDDEEPADE